MVDEIPREPDGRSPVAAAPLARRTGRYQGRYEFLARDPA